MKRESKLSLFSQQAEEILNYGGEFMGQDMYGGGEFMGQDMYSGDGVESIDEADRTLTVVVENTNTGGGPLNAIIFGAFPFPTLTQPTGVTVTVLESSHEQVRRESQINTMYFKGLKYRVSTEAQFDNNVSLIRQTPTGSEVRKIWQPLAFRSAQNQINTQIDATEFAWMVDGRSYWEVPINAATTATFIMQIRTRADVSNVLKGEKVVTLARGKNPTGLPQLDR